MKILGIDYSLKTICIKFAEQEQEYVLHFRYKWWKIYDLEISKENKDYKFMLDYLPPSEAFAYSPNKGILPMIKYGFEEAKRKIKWKVYKEIKRSLYLEEEKE